jgi:hypothetical protein
MGDFSPNVRPVAALKARVWVAQGRLGEALKWTRARGLSAADELSYLREFEHITLARMLLAQSRGDGPDRSMPNAMALLQRVLKSADEGGRIGSVIEILVLQALAHRMGSDIPAALVPLERALALAEPEGYVRIFVDEGPPASIAPSCGCRATASSRIITCKSVTSAWVGCGRGRRTHRWGQRPPELHRHAVLLLRHGAPLSADMKGTHL